MRRLLAPSVISALLSVVPALLSGSGCSIGTDVSADEQAELGSVRAGLSLGELAHDVAAVDFAVVASESGCDVEPIASATSVLETEALPASVARDIGAQRPFADALFVLPPGAYRVCATPRTATGAASSDCAPAEMLVSVVPEQSNEVLLLSQCMATGNGGLDVVVALNDPPIIDAVTLEPSKFITVCEALTISVDAEDPNGDAIAYELAVVSGPEGAHLQAMGQRATFFAPAGDYAIEITVTDAHGNPSSLTIPVHVSAATCEVPAAVQEIFAASCGPCHTTGGSGGLRLSDAATSYARLVATPASVMACSDRVRVVPGAPAESYLIAKLRNTPGICGAPMPRGRPSLPEEQIQVIETWIASLPH